MNTHEIWSILKNDDRVQEELNFLGVFPSDEIPMDRVSHPCCVVVNTHPSNMPGEHWVSLAIDHNGRGMYFDSFGYPPYKMDAICEILEKCESWIFNDKQLQSFFSTVCGQYNIFVLTHLAKGVSMDSIVYLLNDSGDFHANDAFIYSYTNSKYQDLLAYSDLKIIDTNFIINQVANTPTNIY